MTTLRIILTPALALALAACATTPAPAPAPAPVTTTRSDSAISLDLPEAIRWVRLSAEHRAAYLQAYRDAERRIERFAQGRQSGSWAVILDADETVLDNSGHELELARAHQTYNDSNWAAWVHRAAAPALPGSASFIAKVHQLGGRVAIVTNRAEPLCADTRENFRRQSIAIDALLCGNGDKNPRFQAVAAGTQGNPPVDVLMWVGDNIQDFPRFRQRDIRLAPESAYAEFGEHYVILPNPMYGSWDRIPVPKP